MKWNINQADRKHTYQIKENDTPKSIFWGQPTIRKSYGFNTGIWTLTNAPSFFNFVQDVIRGETIHERGYK